jgi:peroxiredoxin
MKMKKIKSQLSVSLNNIQQAWIKETDSVIVEKFNNAINELNNSGIAKTALQVNDKVIDFELNNALGKTVKLSVLLQKGPVILTWYRGGWCPYCNIQLQYMQRYLPQFKAEGAILVALTPELPDKSLDTKEKNELKFEILTDLNNDVARKFGIVFILNNELVKIYNGRLKTFNGVETNELPIPATYVIGQDYLIKYAFVDSNHRHRAEPTDILSVLKTLKDMSPTLPLQNTAAR